MDLVEPQRGTVPGSRVILALALPALGSLAAEPLMGLIDTALIGRVGSVELAALGAANALIGLLAASLIFLEYGTTARLARRFGQGNLELLAREAIQMGWLATSLGIAIGALLMFAPRFLLALVDVPAEVVDPAATYLGIRAWGALPILWLRVANGVFRGIQDTRTPLAIVVGMNALNAVLDFVLIFGWKELSIPALGIVGAAWATTIASWLGTVALLYLLFRRLGSSLRQPGTARPNWPLLRELLAISRDLLARSIGLQIALFTGTRMAASIGTAPLAAHQVAWQLWLALALLLDSLAIAGQALIGRLLGENQFEHARTVGNRLCLWGTGLGVFFCFGFLALRGILPGVFTDEPRVLEQIDSIFVLLAVMQIPNALLFVIDGLLIGASDMAFLRKSMLLLGLFGGLTAWAGAHLLPNLLGVWYGISAFMIVRTLVMWKRWAGSGWVR